MKKLNGKILNWHSYSPVVANPDSYRDCLVTKNNLLFALAIAVEILFAFRKKIETESAPARFARERPKKSSAIFISPPSLLFLRCGL